MITESFIQIHFTDWFLKGMLSLLWQFHCFFRNLFNLKWFKFHWRKSRITSPFHWKCWSIRSAILTLQSLVKIHFNDWLLESLNCHLAIKSVNMYTSTRFNFLEFTGLQSNECLMKHLYLLSYRLWRTE